MDSQKRTLVNGGGVSDMKNLEKERIPLRNPGAI